MTARSDPGGERLAGVRRRIIVIAHRGKPLSLLSDNGTEFSNMAILKWSQDVKIDWHYIASRQADPEGA